MSDGSGWDKIRADVEANKGVLTTTMQALREVHGAGKLGRHVRNDISTELQRRGVGHLPQSLPEYQHEPVRLYLLNSPVAQLIAAVHSFDAESDEVLRRAAGGKDAEMVRKIKELLSA